MKISSQWQNNDESWIFLHHEMDISSVVSKISWTSCQRMWSNAIKSRTPKSTCFHIVYSLSDFYRIYVSVRTAMERIGSYCTFHELIYLDFGVLEGFYGLESINRHAGKIPVRQFRVMQMLRNLWFFYTKLLFNSPDNKWNYSALVLFQFSVIFC